MQGEGILDSVPLWGLFVANLLGVLLSVEVGYRLGRFRRRCSEQEKEAPVGAMVGATLGLFALLLAFTFGFAAARFDARRQVLLDEANAIGTSYLRAELLAEPHREVVRQLLREYVDVRLEAVRTGMVEQALGRSEELHGKLWAQAVAVGEKNPNSIVVGLFIQSLNEVIDLHAKRVMVGLRSRIPGPIWCILYAVAILTLAAMGYHGGLAGTSRSLALLAVALTFSAVMWLIADLDRPAEGALKVSQQAMVDLRNSMNQPNR
jgi:hypothetical protein